MWPHNRLLDFLEYRELHHQPLMASQQTAGLPWIQRATSPTANVASQQTVGLPWIQRATSPTANVASQQTAGLPWIQRATSPTANVASQQTAGLPWIQRATSPLTHNRLLDFHWNTESYVKPLWPHNRLLPSLNTESTCHQPLIRPHNRLLDFLDRESAANVTDFLEYRELLPWITNR